MNRLEATRIVVELAGDAPIVASLGHPAYDLFAAGDRPQNLYTWGGHGARLVDWPRPRPRVPRPRVRPRRRRLAADEPRVTPDDRTAPAAEPRADRNGQRGV